jgi:hypothetical protein
LKKGGYEPGDRRKTTRTEGSSNASLLSGLVDETPRRARRCSPLRWVTIITGIDDE